MTTVDDLVTRAFADWLHGGADSPLRVPLAAAIDDSETTLSLTLTLIGPDEQDALVPGTVAEVAYERMLILDADLAAGTIEVRRGLDGTTKAAHAQGDFVIPQPAYWRSAVFEAVADNIVELYPSLYATRSDEVTVASPFTEVDADAITALHFRWLESGVTPVETKPELWRDYPASTTGAAIFTCGPQVGTEGHFTYRARFPRPTGPSVTLASLGVEEEWAGIVVVGAVADVLYGTPEVDALTSEYIGKMLERESLPPGTSGGLATRLHRFRDRRLHDASRRLRARDDHPVRMLPLGAA